MKKNAEVAKTKNLGWNVERVPDEYQDGNSIAVVVVRGTAKKELPKINNSFKWKKNYFI